jgi:hypothetical protein
VIVHIALNCGVKRRYLRVGFVCISNYLVLAFVEASFIHLNLCALCLALLILCRVGPRLLCTSSVIMNAAMSAAIERNLD